jgi:hypothetical protein
MSTRKLASLLGVVLLLLAAGGCSDDDDGNVLDPDDDSVLLHYDGSNFASPLLAGATYEAAARFPPDETDNISDGALTEVRFFIDQLPASARVKVYGEDEDDQPGPELYSADVTSALVADAWNEHELPTPIDIPNGDLWIAIEFTHVAPLMVIGCDQGPADPDGNWLHSSADDDWIPFDQRGGDNVNWNIRGKVEIVD